MLIEIDKSSGFCFGVMNAIDTVEKALTEGEKIYSLGQIVHNDEEVERLRRLGLQTIDYNQFENITNCKVLIRAHGEPPIIYETARKNNITLLDATCPIVRKLQQKIKKTWEKITETGGQVVILGKAGHAEVLGLAGQTNNMAIITDGESNLDKINYNKKIHLFSQTTMNPAAFEKLAAKISERIKETNIDNPDNLLVIHNTICRQVSGRQPILSSFARKYEVIIFVSGRESSNGKMLFEICRRENPESYIVSSASELRKEWFAGKRSVGVTGATSTPCWLINEVKEAISLIKF